MANNDVILDTNALLMPFQFNVNLDTELDRLVGNQTVCVPTSVVIELKGLQRKEALELAQKYEQVEVDKKADEGVKEAVKKLNGILVTNDDELIRWCKKNKNPVIYLRSKSHLEMDKEHL